MNKNDLILIICILIISLILILVTNINNIKGNTASVYYDNKLIEEIDLNIDKEYDVEGLNGNVHIVVKDKKIKVENENSPLHLCSKQGFIQNTSDTIICLPNKIIIKINNNELDTVIK